MKTQNLCKELELDGIMLAGEVNRHYATGLRTSSGIAFVTPERAFFSTDFRYIEAANVKLSDFTVEMRTREKTFAAIMREWTGDIRRIGFEEDIMTVKEHEAWQKELENIEWVSAAAGIAKMRAVKEPWEIERMKAAQRIAERAFLEVLDVISAGMTEKQAAAELIYRMLRLGADKPSFDPIVVSGPNSSLPHGEPGDRELQKGDFVTVDFGCSLDGYCSDMTRTVAIGYATDEMREVYGVVRKAQLAGIAAAKAGVLGMDIHNAADEVIRNAGYGEYFGHGFGHGIGMEVHEDYNASPGEKRVLEAGMVISAEPGIYIPGKFGVRIEDVIVLRENGCENLMTLDRELITIV
ncbi:MAG: aminopeptidase P family protein [Oscillospiraceae bacterium]|nr:aminopeptidase P family protein [Oscillospiraceae bacterium]